MTKKTKKILFYSAVAVFLVLSYVVVLYAQGYKYNFAKAKFQRTGAISLKTNDDAKIFLNDRLEGNTSFFNNSFSIDRLLPGRYKLTVQKDNYSFWQKTVVVEEGLVINFPHIILLPEEGEKEQNLFREVNLLFEEFKLSSNSFFIDDDGALKQKLEYGSKEIARNVNDFRLSENSNKIIWWNSNELWIMWLNNQNYQPFYKKGDKELISRFLSSILNATWFRGEDHLVLALEERNSRGQPSFIYKLIEIDKRGGVNIVEL